MNQEYDSYVLEFIYDIYYYITYVFFIYNVLHFLQKTSQSILLLETTIGSG